MPTTLIVRCQSHLVVHFPKSQHIDVGDIVYLYAERNKTRSRCRYIAVSTDGSWHNISKFIGNQLRATSYRVKRAECYKVVADTPDSTVTYEDEIDVPMTDATPELPSIPAQLSYPALPDEAQPVQPSASDSVGREDARFGRRTRLSYRETSSTVDQNTQTSRLS